MTTTVLRLSEHDLAARRLVFEPGEGEGMPDIHTGDTGVFIDQATCDRTLAFDAELVSVDAVAASFCFRATGNRAGARGIDFHGGDMVRLMVRHLADPAAGPGIQATIPGQHDVGHGLDEPDPGVPVHPLRPAGTVDVDPAEPLGTDAPRLWVERARRLEQAGDQEAAGQARLAAFRYGATLAAAYGRRGELSQVSADFEGTLRADLTIALAPFLALPPGPAPLLFTADHFREIVLDVLRGLVVDDDRDGSAIALVESMAWRIERGLVHLEAGDLGGASTDGR